MGFISVENGFWGIETSTVFGANMGRPLYFSVKNGVSGVEISIILGANIGHSQFF
jgi:hypothetical protein